MIMAGFCDLAYDPAMCGRFALKTSTPELAQWLEAGEAPDLKPRFNIAPSQNVAVCLQTRRQTRQIREMRWGLIPPWSRDGKSTYSMINARAETLADKASFKGPLQRQRCLIPADGFYEWQKTNQARKQPWFIAAADDTPLGFAGLWERWRGDGHEVESCTIVTTIANDTLRPIHHRMPVILDQDDIDAWLDVSEVNGDQARALLRPCAGDRLKTWPVGLAVNNVRNDRPDCTARLSP